MKGGKKIYEIVKMYNETGFPDDEQSLGYRISVFQETINKVFVEYLVNFDYFTQMMDDYGFVLISKEESAHMGFPAPTGMFDTLHMQMENDIIRSPNKKYEYGEAQNMSPEEKQISFMNRYFIFKKVRNVNPEAVRSITTKYSDKLEDAEEKYEEERDATTFANAIVKIDATKETKIDYETKKTITRKIRKAPTKVKTAPKFVLDEYSPIEDDGAVPQVVATPPNANISMILKTRKPNEKIESVAKERARKPKINIK
jgi:hypothetical protein